jgi:hypothetical protein
MFTDQLAHAIEAAPANHLDQLARQVWQAHGAGLLDDDAAQAAAEAVDKRKRAAGPSIAGGFKNALAAFPARRPQRSPDRQRSIERRRHLAASGPLPPALASAFTTGELAALRIVGDETRTHGVCALHLDAIAARAGVCRTTAQNALREARRRGLVTVQERRRRGQPSATNIVRVISAEWRTWLRLASKVARADFEAERGGGFKKSNTADSRVGEKERERGKPSRFWSGRAAGARGQVGPRP